MTFQPTPKMIKKYLKRRAAKFDNGSPFSVPREAEIATMLERDQIKIAYKIDGFGEVLGVLTTRKADRAEKKTDFAKYRYQFRENTLWIRNVWHNSESPQMLAGWIAGVIAEHRRNFIAVRVYAEDAILCEALEILGMSRQYSNVSAFAEVFAIYTSPGTCQLLDERDRAEDVSLRVVHRDIIGEEWQRDLIARVERVVKDWSVHYSIYNKDGKWSGVAIRGYSDGPAFIEKPTEMSKAWKKEHPDLLDRECRDTKIAFEFVDLIDHLSHALGPLERVRILRLDAKGTIERHCDIQDADAGVRDSMLARFHIPLVTNDQSIFTSWQLDGSRITMHMPERALCYLDHRKPHAVHNTSDEARLHIVADVYSHFQLRRMLTNGKG